VIRRINAVTIDCKSEYAVPVDRIKMIKITMSADNVEATYSRPILLLRNYKALVSHMLRQLQILS
jgi:hypothetical protein